MKNNINSIVHIIGPHASGTSTLNFLLNCHPDIFILFETMLYRGRISFYGNLLLDNYPDLRIMFRYDSNLIDPYLLFNKYLNYKYKFVGDKIPTIDKSLLYRLDKCKKIITIRDIRTWLCKEKIIKIYRTDTDAVTPAVEYVSFLIESFKMKNCCRVSLEEFIHRNDKVLKKFDNFFDLDISSSANDWWQKIGFWEDDQYKKKLLRLSVYRHPSSRIKPDDLDTKTEIKKHHFWDQIMPLFDKYYYSLNKSFTTKEINVDLHKLNNILKISPIPIKDLYKVFHSSKFHLKLIANSEKEHKKSNKLKSILYLPIKWLRMIKKDLFMILRE